MTKSDESKIDKSETSKSMDRRGFLAILTSVLGLFGVVASSVPLLGSMLPSRRTKAIGAPTKVDISSLKEGEILTVQWRKKPFWVIKRSAEQIESIKKSTPLLSDALSKSSTQPEYAMNETRSILPEVGVISSICTHFGCVPIYQKANEAGEGNLPRFFCPCHGSIFDLAGRVYKGMPAPINLAIPPYYFESDTVLIIGLDKPSV